ncbi:hypothetical protein F4825DRAFT_453865 [Nemania diffusa]|nr:hypothetical protein F4825DRAFT_453865 [Nemania diffusa]
MASAGSSEIEVFGEPKLGVELDERAFQLRITGPDKTKDAYKALFQGNKLTKFSTGDLYSKHPTKPHHWKYQGRSDDVIVLSHSEKLHPLDNESMIGSHPHLISTMYIGNERSQPAVTLEMADGEPSRLKADQIIDAVWPLIEKVNSLSPSYGQLHKSHIIIADSSKRFLPTVKGTLRRSETAQLFESEMCEVFEVPARTPRYGVHVDVARSDELHSFIRSWINQKAVYANPTTLPMTRFLGSLGPPQVPEAPEQLVEQQQFLQKVYDQFRRQLPGGLRNLGSYLLDALFRRSDIDTVVCLNRSKNAAECQTMSAAEKDLCIDFNSDRITFIHADLSQPQFGLEQHE